MFDIIEKVKRANRSLEERISYLLKKGDITIDPELIQYIGMKEEDAYLTIYSLPIIRQPGIIETICSSKDRKLKRLYKKYTQSQKELSMDEDYRRFKLDESIAIVCELGEEQGRPVNTLRYYG